tara:strand:- start:2189 stop:2671 length:483 start_codon:yes stop_codon:yes gene_type:complete
MFQLSKFKKAEIYRGKLIKYSIWYLINFFFINSFFPFSKIKIFLLRVFGAQIGNNVIIKDNVNIKFPDKLFIGNDVWIGSYVWIDNIDNVIIKDNCCISQGIYFCTGNHNFKKETFDLTSEEIIINKNSWIGAKSIIGPGVILKENSIFSLGSIITKSKI